MGVKYYIVPVVNILHKTEKLREYVKQFIKSVTKYRDFDVFNDELICLSSSSHYRNILTALIRRQATENGIKYSVEQNICYEELKNEDCRVILITEVGSTSISVYYDSFVLNIDKENVYISFVDEL